MKEWAAINNADLTTNKEVVSLARQPVRPENVEGRRALSMLTQVVEVAPLSVRLLSSSFLPLPSQHALLMEHLDPGSSN